MDQSPTKRVRRNFELNMPLLKEALLASGSRDEHGIICATVSDVTDWVASQRGGVADKHLRNAVYTRLRTGKIFDKREIIAGHKKEKVVFYIKGTKPKEAASGVGSSPLPASGSGGTPRGPAPKFFGVPFFGGEECHRSFFHAEALERGLRRANATLAKLGASTGLHDALGELDVEVLTNATCDDDRWATCMSWHEKYERMKAVFAGAKDYEVGVCVLSKYPAFSLAESCPAFWVS